MPPPRGADFWAPLVRQVLSGSSLPSVAAHHKVSNSALRYWVNKARSASPSPSFLPVRVASPSASRGASLIEMRAEGVRLRFAPGTDPSYLASLLAALRAC